MIRLTVFVVVIGIGLAVLIVNNDSGRILGLQSDDFGRVVYLLPIALMLSAGIWASRRSVGETMRQMMIWLVIILALVTVYLYRQEALGVGNRLLAGLVPGRAVVVTTSEGGQEIILHKLLNGHFKPMSQSTARRSRCSSIPAPAWWRCRAKMPNGSASISPASPIP